MVILSFQENLHTLAPFSDCALTKIQEDHFENKLKKLDTHLQGD